MNPPTKAPKIGIGIKSSPTNAPPIVPPIDVPVLIAIFPAFLNFLLLLATLFLNNFKLLRPKPPMSKSVPNIGILSAKRVIVPLRVAFKPKSYMNSPGDL